jgi:hypothetical protein
MQGKVALIIAERANTFAFVPAGCDDYHPLCRYNAASDNASGSSGIGVRLCGFIRRCTGIGQR